LTAYTLTIWPPWWSSG